jgi:hypothetical protein
MHSTATLSTLHSGLMIWCVDGSLPATVCQCQPLSIIHMTHLESMCTTLRRLSLTEAWKPCEALSHFRHTSARTDTLQKTRLTQCSVVILVYQKIRCSDLTRRTGQRPVPLLCRTECVTLKLSIQLKTQSPDHPALQLRSLTQSIGQSYS